MAATAATARGLSKVPTLLGLLVGLLGVGLLAVGSGVASSGTTERVSVDSAGNQGNSNCSFEAPSCGAAMTTNGRFVAFHSLAASLVPGDINGRTDVFVHDRQTGTTESVSVDSSGNQGNVFSRFPAISADGRFVAFSSRATNLVPGDTNTHEDIFVRDRQTDTTELVSVDSAGNQATNFSRFPAISADGRFVAFRSRATNLVPGDTNAREDIFVHDRQTGDTTRVSVDSSGNQGNNNSCVFEHAACLSMSADGRFVAFYSFASNLVAGDTNGEGDVFVHDRQTGATERVSVDSAGNEGSGDAAFPALSADGRFVAFRSNASNLVPGDTNATFDVFVHDRQTGATTRVSVDSTGTQGNGLSLEPAISADGRFVAFYSLASNLVAGDTNGSFDVFVHDRQTGATERVSVDSSGIEGNGLSGFPALSGDGRFVAFVSDASNLVAGDSNGARDVFVHERGSATPKPTNTPTNTPTSTPTPTPTPTIGDLGEAIAALGLPNGLENSLTAKANTAQLLADNGNPCAAADVLGAFIHQVEANPGGAISEEDAAELIALAELLIADLNANSCPPDPDGDGDGLGNSAEITLGIDPANADTDGDGCTDLREFGSTEEAGGQRDPLNPWDFYDTNGDGIIDLSNDIFGVIVAYASYDVIYDRGPSAGPNAWNLTAPDGVIDLTNDIMGVIQQYQHSCQ